MYTTSTTSQSSPVIHTHKQTPSIYTNSTSGTEYNFNFRCVLPHLVSPSFVPNYCKKSSETWRHQLYLHWIFYSSKSFKDNFQKYTQICKSNWFWLLLASNKTKLTGWPSASAIQLPPGAVSRRRYRFSKCCIIGKIWWKRKNPDRDYQNLLHPVKNLGMGR